MKFYNMGIGIGMIRGQGRHICQSLSGEGKFGTNIKDTMGTAGVGMRLVHFLSVQEVFFSNGGSF